MRLNSSAYLIREGFRSIGTHRFMSFASVAIIMACLIIMGSFSLVTENINAAIHALENQNEVVAYIDENLSEDEARALQPQIEAIDNIATVEFVNRAAAMQNFMSNFSSYVQEGIDETVFRNRFVITLEDITFMAQTKVQIEAISGIGAGNVLAHLDYAKAFVTIRNVVSVISLVMIALLTFISIFIMTNTIKLATFSRREEIAIMRMVGATNSFIRLPFVVEGLVLGILGGALGFAATAGLYQLISRRVVASFGEALFNVVPLSQIALPMFAAYMALSVVVGVFGAVNAIRDYLKV